MAAPVQWLSDKVDWEHSNDPDFRYKIVDFYTKFQFRNIVAGIGDYILISNADAAEPDTVEGCDIGKIVKLYQSHDKDLSDRFRAHVQWYCKSHDVPSSTLSGTNIVLCDSEFIEDYRPYDKDVSIETFYKKCEIVKLPTTAIITQNGSCPSKIPKFLCRYQLIPLTKKKLVLAPVLEDERMEFPLNQDLLKTPQKKTVDKKSKIGTPNSLIKKFAASSLNDRDEWVVKKIEKSKLTLMRDITNSYKEGNNLPHKNVTPKKCRKSVIGNLSPHKNKSENLDVEKTPTRRSIRSARVDKYSNDSDTDNMIDKCATPKAKKYNKKYEQSDEEEFILKTPKKDKSIGTPKARKSLMKTEFTPTRKSLLKSDITPSISARKIPIKIKEGALQTARESLHVSSVPLSLPCREEEFNNIYSFVENKIVDNIGGCMYISGVPGTGKTATVTEVIRCLKKQEKLDELPKFDFIEINGMRLTEPRQAYVHIYKQLTGKRVAWEQACNMLEARFTKPAPRRSTTVLLIDELDVLCNRRQDVLYNLLDWPSKNVAHLVVIAIANTMDLPERLLMGRVASRLGLTRLTFQPYTHLQLQSIVSARLADTGAFNSDAVQLVARKVAAVSGDARRALDICRRAVELAEVHERINHLTTQVSLSHVNQALAEMIASPKVQAIKSCSKMEQIFLQAISSEVQRTGIEETSFHMVYKQMETICAFVGLKVPTITEILGVCVRLGSSRLIINDHTRNDINQKILLNVSSDDVHYATQRIFN